MSTKAPTTQVLGLLTLEQVAELLQCSVSTVERLIKNGELPRVRLTTREVGRSQPGPRACRVTPAALAAFIQGREGRESQGDANAPQPAPAPRVTLPLATGTDGKSRARIPRPRK